MERFCTGSEVTLEREGGGLGICVLPAVKLVTSLYIRLVSYIFVGRHFQRNS